MVCIPFGSQHDQSLYRQMHLTHPKRALAKVPRPVAATRVRIPNELPVVNERRRENLFGKVETPGSTPHLTRAVCVSTLHGSSQSNGISRRCAVRTSFGESLCNYT